MYLFLRLKNEGIFERSLQPNKARGACISGLLFQFPVY